MRLPPSPALTLRQSNIEDQVGEPAADLPDLELLRTNQLPGTLRGKGSWHQNYQRGNLEIFSAQLVSFLSNLFTLQRSLHHTCSVSQFLYHALLK